MKYLGVIGHPLNQSLSPALQQAALDHLRLDIRYEAWPTPRDGLKTRIIGLRGESVLGANVTIPHKQSVIPFLDELDEAALKVGAVNTIVNRERRLFGYNTDVEGFLSALRQDGGCHPEGARAVIAGAGGAARAIAVALTQARAESITIVNRTLARANKLVESLRSLANESRIDSLPEMYASWMAVLPACDLLINCTSVGSAESPDEQESPVPVDLIRSTTLVFDLTYRPAETALLKAARERGARVLGGLPMLVYQGAASFKIWTGQDAPLDIMLEAASRALSAAPAERGA